MEQPANSTAWRTRASRRVVADARTVVLSARREDHGEEVRCATNSPQVARRLRECGQAEDVNTEICERFHAVVDTSVAYMY